MYARQHFRSYPHASPITSPPNHPTRSYATHREQKRKHNFPFFANLQTLLRSLSIQCSPLSLYTHTHPHTQTHTYTHSTTKKVITGVPSFTAREHQIQSLRYAPSINTIRGHSARAAPSIYILCSSFCHPLRPSSCVLSCRRVVVLGVFFKPIARNSRPDRVRPSHPPPVPRAKFIPRKIVWFNLLVDSLARVFTII